MRKTSRTKISFVSMAVAILLIIVLSMAVAATFGKGTQKANMPNIYGESVPIYLTNNDSVDGIVAKKKTQQEAQKEGAAWITNSQELLDFLGYKAAGDVGYLANNITIDYETLSYKSSKLNFVATIDGNGYTINLKAVGGSLNYADEGIAYSTFGGDGGFADNKIRTSGMFVAINRGTIRNANFNYTSNHVYTWSNENTQPNSATMLLSGSHPEYTTVAGIVCGVNYGGTIENCTLKVNNPFVVFHQENVWNDGGSDAAGTNSKAYMYSNSIMVGGFAGLSGLDGSKITKSTIDITAEGSINGLVRGNTYGSNASKHNLAVVGGIAGNFYPGPNKTATISYCTIKGTGAIRGCTAHGSTKNGQHAYTGAIVGSAGYIAGRTDFGKFDIAKTNIHHIMSGWQGGLAYTDGSYAPISSKARLFGAIGNSGMEAGTINGIALLFDYEQFLKNNNIPSPEYLDEGSYDHKVKGNDSAVFIYSKTTAGSINARFDYESLNANRDLRIEAVSGVDATSAGGKDNTFKNFTYVNKGETFTDGNIKMKLPSDYVESGSLKFKMGITGSNEPYQFGNFIWDASFIVGGSSSAHIKPVDLVGAEILLAKAGTPATYAFSFGEIVDYEYQETNTPSGDLGDKAKAYDGKQLNAPKIELISNVANVMPEAEAQGCYFNITKNGAASSLAKTVAPGAYKFTAEYALDEETRVAYFSVDQRLVARKNISKQPYAFTVGPATIDIKVKEQTGNVETWLQKATFEMSINQNGVAVADLFDYITFVRNGEVSPFIPTNGAAVFQYIENRNTTEYGADYSFMAYKTVSNSGKEEKIAVASSDIERTYKVKIDNVAPVIKDVVYTDIDGNVLTADDLTKWRKTNIKISYTIVDDKSKIASGSGHDNDGLEAGQAEWECEFVLEDISTRTIKYSDNAGNTVLKEYSAKIDTTEMLLTIGAVTYPQTLYPMNFDGYDNKLYYASADTEITFVPIYGGSGATLYYSWQNDENNQPIWVAYDKPLPKSGGAGTFIINWDMVNAEVRMKLVNNQNLYNDTFAKDSRINADNEVEDKNSGRVHSDTDISGDITVDNKPQTFTLYLAIANIYIGYENIFYSVDGTNNWAQITAGQAAQQFSKEFDATDAIDSSKYQIRLYSNAQTKELIKKNSVFYSVSYSTEKPLIDVNSLKLTGKYDVTNAGAAGLALKAESSGDKNGRYIIWFNLDEVNGSKPTGSKSLEIKGTTIKPRKVSVSIEKLMEGKMSYVFGEAIPTSLAYSLFENNFDLKFITKAICDPANKVFTDVGNYKVEIDPNSYNKNKNFTFDFIASNFVVTESPVTVKWKIQNGTDEKIDFINSAITFDGKDHKLFGEYKDILGDVKQAEIKYYEDRACLKLLSISAMNAARTYYVKAVPSKNYSTKNITKVYEVKVVKGIVDIKLINNVSDYNKKAVAYKPTLPQGLSPAIFDPSQVKYTYYTVANAKYTVSYDDAAGRKNLVFDSASGSKGTIVGVINKDQVLEPGLYAVKVYFPGNNAFYEKEYDGYGYLCITSARTQLSAEEQTFVYDGVARTYSPVKGNAILSGLDDNTNVIYDKNKIAEELKKFGNGGKIKLQMYNSFLQLYQDVDTSENVTTGVGYVIDAGEYLFKLIYIGDQEIVAGKEIEKYYKGCEIKDIKLIVTKAKISDMTFNNIIKNFDPNQRDGVSFVEEMQKNVELQNWIAKGAKVTYTHGLTTYVTPPKFKSVGEYEIVVKVDLKNYETYKKTFKFTVEQIDLKGISVSGGGEITYDGQDHQLMLVGNGLTRDILGKYRFNGVDCDTVIENDIVHNVMYNDNGEVISTIAKFKITVPNYKTLELNQVVTVSPKYVEEIIFNSAVFSKLDDKTDITKLVAKFVDIFGMEISVPVNFYASSNATGKPIVAGNNGRIPVGTYSVAPSMVEHGNYFTDKYIISVNVKEYSMPTLEGVENGGSVLDGIVYLDWKSPTAKATLNGESYEKGANITKAGTYSIVYTDKEKNIVETFEFTINVSKIVIKDDSGNILEDGAEVPKGKEITFVWDKDNYSASINGKKLDPKQYPNGVVLSDAGKYVIELEATDGTKTSYTISILGKDEKKPISIGAIAGIAVGGVAGVGIIAALIIFLKKKKK